MGTLCVHNAHNLKSSLLNDPAPSRVASNNAADNSVKEEEKASAATTAVAAGEDPAPANSMTIIGAPKDEDVLILPCQAHKGL